MWKNKWIPWRKPFVLEAGTCSTLFPCKIWVNFERNTFCILRFSGWRSALFAPHRPIQLSWRNTCISPKKLSTWEVALSSTLIPCENSIVVERMLPETSVFQCADRLSLFHICLFSRVDETYVSLERNPFVLAAVACSTLFPSEYWVSFQKEHCL
jgi:hypothetical protein